MERNCSHGSQTRRRCCRKVGGWSRFLWAKKRGGRTLNLLQKPNLPIITHAVFLQPTYRQAAIKALHEDTQARQHAADPQDGMRPGIHGDVKTCATCQSESPRAAVIDRATYYRVKCHCCQQSVRQAFTSSIFRPRSFFLLTSRARRQSSWMAPSS